MTQLILTAIGNDRAGLVSTLADTVRFHGGNWEHSEMAEIQGIFAGLIQVSVPDTRLDEFLGDLDDLDADIDVQARLAGDTRPTGVPMSLRLVGDDRPGIVGEVSGVLAASSVTMTRLDTSVRSAPMSGGQLFELDAVVLVPADTDPTEVARSLEQLSHEIIVEFMSEHETP